MLYAKMNEAAWSGASGEVIDASGNGNHGTAVNGATPTTGLFGNAGLFDHSIDNYVDFGADDSLYPTSQVTIAAWVNPSNAFDNLTIGGAWGHDNLSENSYVLYSGQDAANDSLGFYIQQADGSLVFIFPADNAHLVANSWQHVAAVADGSMLRIYYNSVDSGYSVPYDGTLQHVTKSNVVIGALIEAGTYGWGGMIDELRIYNRGLSASEIQQLYDFVPSA